MVDRVRPLKIEDTGTGGSQNDQFPTTVNPNEDYLDSRGLTLQTNVSNDGTVRVERVGTDLTFVDGSGTKTLSSLSAGSGVTESAHKTLLQLIHFISEGPAEGFVTGATRVTTGTALPSQILWKRADNTKLVQKDITYSGAFPATIQWQIFDTDGTTILATVTDTITYSGAFETSRVRSIS